MNIKLATAGFTLIELVVTIAIAGILLALAVPSFREITLNNQRASMTNELVSALNFARGQALALRRPVVMCRIKADAADPPVCGQGAGWEEGWVVFQDIDRNNAPTDAQEILRRRGPLISNRDVARAASARLAIRSNVNPSFTFQPSGTSTAGRFAVCDDRGTAKGATVVVSAVGQVRTESTVASCTP